jgi:hypothetical protein
MIAGSRGFVYCVGFDCLKRPGTFGSFIIRLTDLKTYLWRKFVKINRDSFVEIPKYFGFRVSLINVSLKIPLDSMKPQA